jgi:hypothetical protein
MGFMRKKTKTYKYDPSGKKGDIGYQTLLKIWIAERTEKEIA